MNKQEYIAWIEAQPSSCSPIEAIDGTNITYASDAVWVDPDAPDFRGYTTRLNDEEAVRAVFLLLIARDCGYALTPNAVELEHVYEAPGRPRRGAKGCRADVIVRDKERNPYLFVELKTPHEFSRSRKLIDGQLFQAA